MRSKCVYVFEVESFETLLYIPFPTVSYILIVHCHLKYVLTFTTGGGSIVKLISRMEFMIFEWPLRYFHEKPANAQMFFLLINVSFINAPHRDNFDVQLVMS